MSDQPGGPAGPEGALQYRSMTTAASDQLLSTKYRDWQCEEGWRGWFKLVPADPQHADAQLALWKRLKAQGYQIHLFYVWLSTDALAEVRVKGRVQAGGHDIPPAVIRRRFSRSVQNFLRTYRLVADSWALFDNSGDTLVFIASGKGENALIMDPAGYQRIWEAQETP